MTEAEARKEEAMRICRVIWTRALDEAEDTADKDIELVEKSLLSAESRGREREREEILAIVEDQALPFDSTSNEAACAVRDIASAIRKRGER